MSKSLSMHTSFLPPSLPLSLPPLPSHFSCPLAMMAMVSPSMSASSMECVVMIITLSFFILSIRFHTSLRIFGSIPVVGSSRNITRGSPRKLRATLSLRFMPPLNVLTRWSATCTWSGAWGMLINYNSYSVIVHGVLHPCATSQTLLVAGIVQKAA